MPPWPSVSCGPYSNPSCHPCAGGCRSRIVPKAFSGRTGRAAEWKTGTRERGRCLSAAGRGSALPRNGAAVEFVETTATREVVENNLMVSLSTVSNPSDNLRARVFVDAVRVLEIKADLASRQSSHSPQARLHRPAKPSPHMSSGIQGGPGVVRRRSARARSSAPVWSRKDLCRSTSSCSGKSGPTATISKVQLSGWRPARRFASRERCPVRSAARRGVGRCG